MKIFRLQDNGLLNAIIPHTNGDGEPIIMNPTEVQAFFGADARLVTKTQKTRLTEIGEVCTYVQGVTREQLTALMEAVGHEVLLVENYRSDWLYLYANGSDEYAGKMFMKSALKLGEVGFKFGSKGSDYYNVIQHPQPRN